MAELLAANQITIAKVLDGEKGEKGDKGEKGEQGIQGIRGLQGLQGEKGEQGIQGLQGETGPQGPQGIQGPKGEDGSTYYTWIKYADTPTSGMSDNPTGKTYIGIAYNKSTPIESTNYSDYAWSLIKGDKGDKGETGATGPQGPQGEQGIQGEQGPKGDTGSQGPKGDTGATGNGISAITYYYKTTTAQAAPTPSTITSTTMPTMSETDKYLWQKEIIEYTDGTKQTTVLLLAVYGDKGATGPQGEQGVQGPKGDTGADGKTSYFHIKYSAVSKPTSSSEMSETPQAYIGTYVDFIEADSTDPTKYTWSRFEGIQGEKGEQGIPGIGQDGRTSYLHIAYATSADGSEGFSISESANKTYIGQYTDFVSTDSTDHTKYAWTKIKGETGADGYSPTVTTGTSSDGSTTVTVTNKDASTTTTLVDGKARADIDNLEIGGRNLAKRENITANFNSFSKIDGYEYTQWVGDGAGILFPADMFTEGTEYILSFKFQKISGTLTSIAGHSTAFDTHNVVINGKSFPQHWIETHPIEDSDAVQTCVVYLRRYTASEISETETNYNLYIQPQRWQYHGSNDIMIKYWDIKIEKGNKATDWTPAPEDVDAGIKDAAKVATNFIGYDSDNGLIIGNKTSGTWSGYRSQILPGSFNVLDASSTVLASFGTTTVIGEEAKANMHLTFNNLSMVDKDGTTLFKVGDNRNAEGIATIKHTAMVVANSTGSATVTVDTYILSIISVYADSVQLSNSSYSFSQTNVTINNLTANSQTSIEITYTTDDSSLYLTFGNRDSSGKIGRYSVAEGQKIIASGQCSHAEGAYTEASGSDSHAEGNGTNATGRCSHAEGVFSTASAEESHAEGYDTKASGEQSHAEGYSSKASGKGSHAEGRYSEASGEGSHAEGRYSEASGEGSHAGGYSTVADGNYMTAIGKYNTKNSGKAFVIGNGDSDKARSDAFTVDWTGNIYMGLRDCNIADSGTALSVSYGASTLDGLLAQAIIGAFSYADAKEILEI